MARVLITGGTGFVGSHIVRALRARYDEVALFIRSKDSVSEGRTIPEDCKLYEGDIRAYADVLRAFTDFKPELVFHAAAALSRGTSEVDDQEAMRVNREGTQHVVDAIAHMKEIAPVRGAIIYGSSVEYGVSTHALAEDMIGTPIGSYAISKQQGTQHAIEKAAIEQLPLVVVRIFTPYGPGMNANSFVHKVFANALQDRDIMLSSTSVTRDFIYIDDLVSLSLELVECAAEHPGEIFNAGSGVATTLYGFATRVVEKSSSQSKIVIDASWLSAQDQGVWQADMTKTLHTLSWTPSTDLNTGISLILEQFPQ